MLKDAHFMSIADRSILACWGVKGGKAGRPFQVTVDPGGPNEREVDALADDEPVRAGEVIRIRTTGGGGWGDPLERDVDLVVRDVRWGKVSVDGARNDYGVVVTGPWDAPGADAAATAELRRAAADGACGRWTAAVLRPRSRLRHAVRGSGGRGGRLAVSTADRCSSSVPGARPGEP